MEEISYICIEIIINYQQVRVMTKYNITAKKEKEAHYRSLVSPKLMDELKEKINRIVVMEKKYIIQPRNLPKNWEQTLATFLLLSMCAST